MEIKELLDKFCAEWRKRRAETQMTLGKLIEVLEAMPPEQKIEGFGGPHSYRGFYEDLAFSRKPQRTAGEALEMARECLGQTFEGYKGGKYKASEGTPLWIAEWGSTGMRLMGICDGKLEVQDDNSYDLVEL